MWLFLCWKGQYQLLPLSQELLQNLGFEGLEWDVSGEKNELVVYRKDHSMKMLLQSRKVRDCQPVVFILAFMREDPCLVVILEGVKELLLVAQFSRIS